MAQRSIEPVLARGLLLAALPGQEAIAAKKKLVGARFKAERKREFFMQHAVKLCNNLLKNLVNTRALCGLKGRLTSYLKERFIEGY